MDEQRKAHGRKLLADLSDAVDTIIKARQTAGWGECTEADENESNKDDEAKMKIICPKCKSGYPYEIITREVKIAIDEYGGPAEDADGALVSETVLSEEHVEYQCSECGHAWRRE